MLLDICRHGQISTECENNRYRMAGVGKMELRKNMCEMLSETAQRVQALLAHVHSPLICERGCIPVRIIQLPSGLTAVD